MGASKGKLEGSILLRYNRLMEPYDVGIILGHISTGFGITSRQKKRMQKGVELFTTARITSVMTTGGKGMWKKTTPSMGEVARAYLISCGVKTSRILVEDQSINTIQNAKSALRLMQRQGFTSALIITSADHMPRAKRIFEEVFPPTYHLDFIISDSFCGIWSVIDFFWNGAGNLKRAFRKASRHFQ
jgi:uncharacterized SAM-binding protein YcdF (DUF218 family)